jgi:hypothetical protein
MTSADVACAGPEDRLYVVSIEIQPHPPLEIQPHPPLEIQPHPPLEIQPHPPHLLGEASVACSKKMFRMNGEG